MSPGERSKTRWIVPHESGLLSHQAEEIAVMPERTLKRAAKVLNESPPSKRGTSTMAVLTVQLAAACAKPSSPRTTSLRSASETCVWKSCLSTEPSVPPQPPRHSRICLWQTTSLPMHVIASKSPSWNARPRSPTTTCFQRRHVSYMYLPTRYDLESSAYSAYMGPPSPCSACICVPRMRRHIW